MILVRAPALIHPAAGVRLGVSRAARTAGDSPGCAPGAADRSGSHDRMMTIVETRGVDVLLARARAGVRRLGPHQVAAAVAGGALLVDTRTDVQRREQGELPGSLVIDRTVLEWRLDPGSPDRIPEATGYDLAIIVVCRQGYSSSLAAASLRALGLDRATDMIGGVEAWLAAGLPSTAGPADVRR
jgi:rhodanese-related sulfurtransferase